MKKILIVDDSLTIVRLIGDILEKAGFEVETIVDSSEFLTEKPKIFNPDLIILDINMPVYDGYYILEYISGDSFFVNIKVMMCSTKFFMQDKLKALRLGADDFLVKPFTEEELLEKINRLLSETNK